MDHECVVSGAIVLATQQPHKQKTVEGQDARERDTASGIARKKLYAHQWDLGVYIEG